MSPTVGTAMPAARLQWGMSHEPAGDLPLKSDTFGRILLIRDAGREPIERDTLYNVVRVPAFAS